MRGKKYGEFKNKD